jgi:predicted TIM-barrel fold metal-dependent hydrolase
MESPLGDIAVSDAHVHFFSHRFFSMLAAQAGCPLDEAASRLPGWEIPPPDPLALAGRWVAELDAHGVASAAIIASLPGDWESVAAAAAAHPERLHGYFMANPAAPGGVADVAQALEGGLRGVCLFPAMHRYSMHDERVTPVLDAAAATPGALVFVHCGVLTVGIRAKLGLPSPFDMRHSNPIDVHALALRYPRLPFVVPHFGAGYFREALMLCDLCPNVYLDTSSSNSWMKYYAPPMDLRAVFAQALEVAGPQRLLFGSDSSFFPRGWVAPVFAAQSTALYELGVSAEDAALIFGGNLRRLLSGA